MRARNAGYNKQVSAKTETKGNEIYLMDLAGFEPAASAVRVQRSTAELQARIFAFILFSLLLFMHLFFQKGLRCHVAKLGFV